MNRKRFFHTLMCVLILLFILLAPSRLAGRAASDLMLDIFDGEKPDYYKSVVMYHVVSHRTYGGSVTNYLKRQAAAFSKLNPGMNVQVVGMDEAEFNERLEYGRVADCYSFFGGLLYTEQLTPMALDLPALKNGLKVNAYAVPYFYSGYALCSSEPFNSEFLLEGSSVQASAFNHARLGLAGGLYNKKEFLSGKEQLAVLELSELAELMREESLAGIYIDGVDGFTELVCYLGLARGAADGTSLVIQRFFEYLLTPKAQAELNDLGAFSVLADYEDIFSDSFFKELDELASNPITPNPFLWHTHKAELLADAELALSNDEAAKKRFTERFMLVCE